MTWAVYAGRISDTDYHVKAGYVEEIQAFQEKDPVPGSPSVEVLEGGGGGPDSWCC